MTVGAQALLIAAADVVMEQVVERLKAGAVFENLAALVLENGTEFAARVFETRDALAVELRETDRAFGDEETTLVIVALAEPPASGKMTVVARTADGRWTIVQIPGPRLGRLGRN
jgi:hypothetical protein